MTTEPNSNLAFHTFNNNHYNFKHRSGNTQNAARVDLRYLADSGTPNLTKMSQNQIGGLEARAAGLGDRGNGVESGSCNNNGRAKI